jgi:hypothetical protein
MRLSFLLVEAESLVCRGFLIERSSPLSVGSYLSFGGDFRTSLLAEGRIIQVLGEFSAVWGVIYSCRLSLTS